MSTDRAANLAWKPDGDGFILVSGRRRFGKVMPDPNTPGMWRSKKPDGTLSDHANISWAKNAVLLVAERELEFENRERCATDPPKCPENGGVFRGSASSVAPSRPAGVGHPRRERRAR
jgi:hypothetical protein